MKVAMLLLMLVISGCYGEQIDMTPYRQLILDIHNKYRKEEPAANMNKLQWSDTAEAESRKLSDSCNAHHPANDWGQNLAWKDANTANINDKISDWMFAWHDEKKYYTFGQENCGAPKQTCHYMQVIWAPTRFIGCSISKCNVLQIGSNPSPMPMYYFVCYYKIKSYGDWDVFTPYEQGATCSKCSYSGTCDDGFCYSTKGEDEGNELDNGGDGGKGGGYPGGDGTLNTEPTEGDQLEPREQEDLLNEENTLRKGLGLGTVSWDAQQEKIANYIINCETEYGAYPQDYVNHGKAKYGTLIDMVLNWIKEGPNVNLKGYGCRSTNGGSDCSHYSNMGQPSITKMGCASKACGKDGRQLTCIYTA